MLIEIKGVQFVNKGAELMLHAVLQQLQTNLPDAQIVMEPGVNAPFDKRMQIGALQKFSLRRGRFDLNRLTYFVPAKIRRWARRDFGVVTEADIDVVLDASGFAYGDQWPAIKVKHLSNEIVRCAKAGKRYVLLPQALGPFSREEDQQRLRRAVPHAALVFPREQSSFKHLTDVVGVRDNVVASGDFTNLVEPIVDAHWLENKPYMLVIPNYNMLDERNQQKAWQSHYVNLMAESVALASEMRMKPVILNHEGKEDQRVCEAIQAASSSGVEIVHEQDALKVKGIIQHAALIVCSRFHGCVSGLSQGTPCLGTSWSHKYERLFEEYGLSECLLTPEESRDALREKMRFALEESIEQASDARATFKKQSVAMWQRVFEAIR